ncbi:hypothetical protein NDU88_005795 [Pleurodeles waltl]|uniref:Uncharacterized protein n=1 Tax=Pleurodeles waltl TaxID=8319 RepID=A0AAV7LM81_PLEWA|nr:hypothetical protein NDU88_005795 [Pleurodeles waltl]
MGPLGAPLGFSLSALQTVKIATGATAPVATLQLRRLHSEPASLLQGLSSLARGRPFGGRPPAQRESRNDPAVFRRGNFGRRPPPLAKVGMTPKVS